MSRKTDVTPVDLGPIFEARGVPAQKAAIIALQNTKSLAAASREPPFAHLMAELEYLAMTGQVEAQLQALALLFRIGAGVKALRPRIEATAAKVTEQPSVSPQVLEDKDDRRYLGEALKFSSGNWKRRYLAVAAVEEVAGEEARGAFITGLILETSSIADSLRALSDSFELWSISTQDVAASRARRLIRVATAVKNSIVELDPPPGKEVGNALLSFCKAALGGEKITDRDLQAQTAMGLLELLSTVVRFHFSLASEVETFAIIPFLHRWFQSRGWPSRLDKECTALARQITEALVLLAKQGIGDDGLRKALHTVLDETQASIQLSRIANELPGIPSDLRTWILSGRRSVVQLATSDAVHETIIRTIDRDIAELFRDATETESVFDRLEDDLVAAVGAYEPKLTPTATRLISTIHRIAKRIEALAAKRSMQFGSRTGEIVEFNPIDHEPLTTGGTDRIVKILRPSVERAVEGMPPTVVLKAEVGKSK